MAKAAKKPVYEQIQYMPEDGRAVTIQIPKGVAAMIDQTLMEAICSNLHGVALEHMSRKKIKPSQFKEQHLAEVFMLAHHKCFKNIGL